jgi:hypothetical protein
MVDNRKFWQLQHKPRWESLSTQADLAALRLVNRRLCKCASRRLFRVVGLTTKHSYRLSVDRLFNMCNSHLVVHFRKLNIHVPSGGVGLIPLRLFIEDLAVILPICLTNFRNLTAISVCDDSPVIDQHLCFNNTLRHRFDNCLLTALRYAPLHHLTELHLRLRAAEDFHQLLGFQGGTKQLSSLMSRLQHLSVAFIDKTGDGGQRYVTEPPSNIQIRFPNREYELQFFAFIQLAKNLRSLQIKCTHVFDLDNLDHLCICPASRYMPGHLIH